MSSDKVQILVVDDDISHCTILQALLRGWGYQVGLAHNGLQALEQIHQQVFDLVLCDIRMAEMDGIATLKEIKAYNPAIPVLIMTAFSSVGTAGNDSNLLIVFYVQIMPDDFVMQLHRF
ncbi:Transcriptional regulatory protein ZraR [Klebsiella pneumoniae]|nr:Transcriptional regulatory protein ZraR [Klebsiella pneumoniae]CAH5750794.1 Transcriptional regulatory protein ZraR [Klebsiella pneumoniae]